MILAFIVGLSTFHFMASAFAQPNQALGLKEIQEYAVRNNFELQTLRYAIEAERGRSERLKAPFWPVLGVAGGGTVDSSLSKQPISPTLYGYATYNLFNGFQDTLNLNLSERDVSRKQAEINAAVFKIEREVEQRFQFVVTKRALIEVMKSALELNKKNQDLVRRRQSMGAQSAVDVMEFSQREAILTSDQLATEQDLQESKIELARVIGGTLGAQLEPTGFIEHRHLAVEPVALISQLAKTSQSLKVIANDVEKSALEQSSWRSKWLPRVDLEVRVDAPVQNVQVETNTPDESTSGSRTTISALLKFDLFQGFESFSERTERHARYLQSETELKSAVAVAISNAERLFKKLQATERRMDIEAQNSERADKYYKAVMGEYQRGFKNSADVAAAAENLLNVQIRDINFRYEFAATRLELENILGRTIETKIHDLNKPQ